MKRWSVRVRHAPPSNPSGICEAHAGVLGAVAHLGERFVRNEEVEGSIPFSSTATYNLIFSNTWGRNGGSHGKADNGPRATEGSIPSGSTRRFVIRT